MSAYTHASQFAELKDKIRSIRFAMFTTQDQDGQLLSRPMTSQDIDSDGNLWFYTSTSTALWLHIAAHPRVNLSFAEPEAHTYVSVSGTAERVVDREQIKAMWNAGAQAWYPNGPNDPHVVLIRVLPEMAEYWDAGSSSMVQLFNMARAVLTGSTPDDGKHGRITM